MPLEGSMKYRVKVLIIDEDIYETHLNDVQDAGIRLRGNNAKITELNSELFSMFIELCVGPDSDKPVIPKEIYAKPLKKYADIIYPCQTPTCDSYDLTSNLNCKLDKKIECYANYKKHYTGKYNKTEVRRQSYSDSEREKRTANGEFRKVKEIIKSVDQAHKDAGKSKLKFGD